MATFSPTTILPRLRWARNRVLPESHFFLWQGASHSGCPEVVPRLASLAYRKPRLPLKRFSNLSYLQRVDARNCLAVRTHLPPDALSFPRLAATQLLSVPHNVAFARRMVQQSLPSFRFLSTKRTPAHAPGQVESLQRADSLARASFMLGRENLNRSKGHPRSESRKND